MLIDGLFLLALIMLNGALALSEIAVVSARRARLAGLVEEGHRGASRVLELASDPTRFLSTVQVGITSIGILSGAIGEATLVGPMQQALETAGVPARYAAAIALGAVVVLLTYVSLIVGELVPKRLALTDPERIASLVAAPMQVLARMGRPVVYVLSVSTDLVLKMLRVPTGGERSLSVEEIRLLLEQSANEGVLEPNEREMMTNVLGLDDRHVGGVLTPRAAVVYLDLREPLDVNRARMRRTPHDTLPLCDGSLDAVMGVIRTRRLLDALLGGEAIDLRALAEPALFVPETISILRLLEEFRRTRLSAALVMDEFGGVEGIVSMTDVMTSILGPAPEDGPHAAAIVRREDGSWLMDGSIDLEALERTLGDDPRTLDEGAQHVHTLGGFVMAALGRVPKVGDVFTRGHYRYEVVDMDGHRVDRVLVVRRREPA